MKWRLHRKRIIVSEGLKTKYLFIPRAAIKLLEYEIGVMADWIKRSGLGADMKKLKKIQNKFNMVRFIHLLKTGLK